MAEERKETWHKILAMNDIFHHDDFIILTLPDMEFPMKLHPQICHMESKRIGLKLPHRWWQFFEFTSGMQVRLTKMHQDGIFYITGKVIEVNLNKLPSISVTHDGSVKRDQRRFFYRVNVDQEFVINEVTMPEGQRIMNCPARLFDISAGGIGFGVRTFMPPGTTLKVKNFLEPLVGDAEETEHELQVIWCRVHRGTGFRVGACFNYPDIKEQDDMVKMINQVQRINLNKYYHVKRD